MTTEHLSRRGKFVLNPYASIGSLDALDLRWDDEGRRQSLRAVYDHAVTYARSNITWYDNNKRSKRRLARILRIIAIIAAGLGGTFPLLADLVNESFGASLSPTWGTAIIALAGGAVAFDQFFGYSTSWIRSITTGMNLRTKLEKFEFAWETEMIKVEGTLPTRQEAQVLIKKVDDFVAEVSAVIKQETDEWVTEFQNSLSALNRRLSEEGQKSTRGALKVTVENGTSCDNGWTLYLDGREIDTYKNTNTAALVDLMPKTYQVKVEGKVGGQEVRAEGICEVTASNVGEMTLSIP